MNESLANITALVLAGGLGTRLRQAVADRPKALAEINGRPFLAFLLDRLALSGVRRVILCTGYMGKMLQSTFGSSYGTMAIEYSQEAFPLGTGGALRQALPLVESNPVLVLNGDSFLDADLTAFLHNHQLAGARNSLLVTRVANAQRYGSVILEANGQIGGFVEKGETAGPGRINAGVYLLQREVLEAIPTEQEISLERQVFPALIGSDFYGFTSNGCFIDIGTPDSYRSAGDFFRRIRTQRQLAR